MTTIEHHPQRPACQNAIALLVQSLWDGKISEQNFIAEASQLGAPIAQIEYEIEQLKTADGVL